MTLERFKEAIAAIKAYDDDVDKLYELGINVVDSSLSTYFDNVCKYLFEEAYGEHGEGWIEWYLFELPPLLERHLDPSKLATDFEGTRLTYQRMRIYMHSLRKTMLRIRRTGSPRKRRKLIADAIYRK